MLLRLEERIEVPERRLNVVVGWHLLEAAKKTSVSERIEKAGEGPHPISRKISFIIVRHLRRV
jgi:hypothetical protein